MDRIEVPQTEQRGVAITRTRPKRSAFARWFWIVINTFFFWI